MSDETMEIVQLPDEEITSSQSAMPILYDPESQLRVLEKAVLYGPRILAARNKLIRMFTYAEDWTCFGDGVKAKACLSAPGACRIADKGNFPIKYHGVSYRKEWLKDKENTVIGYRYIYEGYATLGERTVHILGQYSTRDHLLGKAGGNFRDYIEINESHIQQAAHTYFKGNAIKDLLGLKAVPWAEYEKLTDAAGQNASNTTQVQHKTGKQGGIADDDRTNQNVLFELLSEIAQLGKVIVVKEEGGKITQSVEEISDELASYAAKQIDPYAAVAQASLRSLTTFMGKDGKITGTTDFGRVKGKQLEIALKTAQRLKESA